MTSDRDQIEMRLRDLYRLRELIRVYGHGRQLRIADMPEPARTQAREILDRIGDLDNNRQALRRDELLLLAAIESCLDSMTVTPQNAEEIERLRRMISRHRSALTGLPEES